MGGLMGCRSESAESKHTAVGSADIAHLDSVDLSGQMVSVGGFVSTPYNGHYLVLDDGTGRIPVILPESLELGVGRRLLIQGLVGELEGFPAITADVWLYDSTGTPVRSP
jgi:hypothetical protein